MVRRLLIVPPVFLAFVACTPTEQRMCERLDECNALAGVSVDECVNDLDDDLAELADSDEKDCRDTLDRCLQNESCDNFAICVLEDAPIPCGGTVGYYYYYYL